MRISDWSSDVCSSDLTKDMLKVGGENVAAAEIEAMLQTHPAVKLAQVVGIPHDRYVEVPAAFVELAEGQSATEDELIQHCRGQLASRSDEHTSELQSLMRISYAAFCLKHKKKRLQ